MLKKTLLSALLLASSISAAQFKIDLNMVIGNGLNKRTVKSDFVIENDTVSTLVEDNLIIDFLVQEDGDIITVFANVYEKTEEDNIELLAQPIIVTSLDEVATITLSNEDETNEESAVLTFEIITSRVE